VALRLPSREVHSWCVRLDAPPEICAGLHATLTDDERDRSARLRWEQDRQRFIVAHGALRALLGRYLRTHPGDLRFVYNAFGKPELSPEFGGRLKFNLSHAADLALIAIAVDAAVGVDLEYIRRQPDYAEIARWFFSPAEVDDLNRVPSHLHAEAFLSYWTKKEAYVKARGEGLAIPLTSFSVPHLQGAWSLYSLQPAAGYVGALAVAGSGWRLRQWHWHASAVLSRS
jgi:4'-phosphopantetheinyl transferase